MCNANRVVAFKKLHVTDDWKKINDSDNNLFTTFALDNSKGFLVYADIDDKEQTLKFVQYTTLQIFGNCFALERQSFDRGSRNEM